MMRLTDLPIATRLLSLAVIPIFAFLILGISYYVTSRTASDLRFEKDALAKASEAEVLLLADIMVLELRFFDYVQNRLKDQAQQHDQRMESTLKRMADLEKAAAKSLATTDIDNLRRALLKHKENFQELADTAIRLGSTDGDAQSGFLSEEGMRHILDQSIQDIDALLANDINRSIGTKLTILNEMALIWNKMRSEEKDFNLGGSGETHREKIDQLRAQFVDLVKRAPMLDDDKIKYQDFADSYYYNFDAFSQEEEAFRSILSDSISHFQNTVPLFEEFGQKLTTLNVAASQAAEDGEAQAEIILLITALGTAILLIVAWFLIARSVRIPVHHLTATLNDMGHRQADTVVPCTDQKDELGEMARAIKVLQSHSLDRERLKAEQAEQQAKNRAEIAQRMNALAEEFDVTIKNVANLVLKSADEIEHAAETMASNQESASSRSLRVSESTEATVSRAETVSHGVEELSASIADISHSMSRALDIARRAVSDVDHAAQEIHEMTSAAEEISNVVGLIRDIANQTNLLALNATIEAARAGEAGKGFAVVAGEVKALANQTGNATEDINHRVQRIQDETNAVVEAMTTVRKVIHEIEEIATTVAGAVEEQGAAAQEISSHVQGVTQDMAEVSDSVSEVISGSLQSCSQAVEMIWCVDALKGPARQLAEQADNFMTMIRESA